MGPGVGFLLGVELGSPVGDSVIPLPGLLTGRLTPLEIGALDCRKVGPGLGSLSAEVMEAPVPPTFVPGL